MTTGTGGTAPDLPERRGPPVVGVFQSTAGGFLEGPVWAHVVDLRQPGLDLFVERTCLYSLEVLFQLLQTTRPCQHGGNPFHSQSPAQTEHRQFDPHIIG